MKTIFIVICLMPVVFCSAQHLPNEWEGQPLKGKVKKIRSNFGGMPGTIQEMEAVIFDSTSYVVDSFSETGLLLLEYHVQNDVISVFKHYKYVLEEKGRISQEYEYCHITNTQDTLVVHISYRYDDNGHMIQEVCNVNSRDVRCVNYIYSGDRIRIMEDSTVDQGLMERTIYYYGGNRNERLQVFLYQNGITKDSNVFEITFDRKHNKVSELRYKSGKIEDARYYTYNDNNNVVLTRWGKRGDEGFQFISEYIYDDHENWIRRITDQRLKTLGNEVVYEATIRQIEYY